MQIINGQKTTTLQLTGFELQAIAAALDTQTKTLGLQCVMVHAALLQKIDAAAKDLAQQTSVAEAA